MTTTVTYKRVTIPDKIDCPSWCSVKHNLRDLEELAALGFIGHGRTVVDEADLLVELPQVDNLAYGNDGRRRRPSCRAGAVGGRDPATG